MKNNLKAEMVRHKVTAKDIAQCLHLSEKTIYQKINGKSDWQWKQVLEVQERFFPGCDVNYLFSDDPETQLDEGR